MADQPQDLTDEQKLGLALVALLTPAAGYALGGKQGAYAGAAAGAKAAGGGLADFAERQQKAKAKQEATDLYEKQRKDKVDDAVEIDRRKKENEPAAKQRRNVQRNAKGQLVDVDTKEIVDATTTPEKPPKDVSISERNTLQSQYDRDPETRKNKMVISSWQDAEALSKDPSPASDHALVFSYMKAMDPGSVVKETEHESAAALGGLQQRAAAKLKEMAGEGRLTPQQRADLMAQIRKLAQSAGKKLGTVNEQFTGLAERRSVPVEDLRFAAPPQIADQPGIVIDEGSVSVRRPTPEQMQEARRILEERRKAKGGS